MPLFVALPVFTSSVLSVRLVIALPVSLMRLVVALLARVLTSFTASVTAGRATSTSESSSRSALIILKPTKAVTGASFIFTCLCTI
jgi:hypothetical protein